jgi:hypothetical protein
MPEGGKGDDAGLPVPTLTSIISSLARTNREVFATIQALAIEENSATDSKSAGRGTQIKNAFAACRLSAAAVNQQVGSLARSCSRLRSDLQRLKRAYGPKRRRIPR